jgi:hypothetical protein
MDGLKEQVCFEDRIVRTEGPEDTWTLIVIFDRIRLIEEISTLSIVIVPDVG